MRLPLRPSAWAGFLSLSLLFCGACSRHETAVASGNRDKILHFGNNSEPRDLDPQTNIGEPDGFIIEALFEGLVYLQNDGHTIVPGGAERWEISPDGKTYTFHLRADAKWTNGEAVTAEDFRTGFLRLLEPALACESSPEAFFIKGARDYAEGRTHDAAEVGLRAIDARTFEIKLNNRTPFFLSLLSSWPFKPVHRATLEKFDGLTHRDTPWTKVGNIVGNGRFILKEWRVGQIIVVAKNPAHWDAANTKLNEIRFYPIEDGATEEHAFRAGQLHVTYGIPESKIAGYQTSPLHELSVAPLRRTRYVTFNTKVAPFQDEKVRRAFALAIDRPRVVQAALGGLGEAAYSLTRPDTGGYTAPVGFRLDPTEARRLLAEAGYPGGKGFPAVECMLTGKTGSVIREAEILQQMWAQNLGVQVKLQPTEWKVYLNAIRIKKFQFLIEGWGYINDPWDPLQLAVTDNPNNDADWSSPAYDRAFADAETAATDAQRHADFDTAENLIAAATPYTPLYFTNRARLVQPSVRNWRDNPAGMLNWSEFSLDAK